MSIKFTNNYGNKAKTPQSAYINITRACTITNYKQKEARDLVNGDLTINYARGNAKILEGKNTYRKDNTADMNEKKYSVFQKIVGMDTHSDDLTLLDIKHAYNDYLSNKKAWTAMGVKYFGYDPKAEVIRLEIEGGGTLKIDFETDEERKEKTKEHVQEAKDGLYWEHHKTPYFSFKKDFRGFKYALGWRESADNYESENIYHYLGRYQMGVTAMADAEFFELPKGWKTKDGNNWADGEFTDKAKEYGVSSDKDFLKNPKAQDIAFKAYTKRQWAQIKFFGLDKYINLYPEITQSGLIAGAHLLGVGNLKKYLEKGIDMTDGFGTHISEYIKKFSGYDMSDLFKD